MNRFFISCIAVSCAIASVSCNKEQAEPEPEQLSSPVLTISEQDYKHFTITWNAVENAASYSYSINGEEETSTTELSFTVNEPAYGDYTVKVKAVPADETYLESDYSEITVSVVPPEPVEPHGSLTINGETYEYDRCVCYYGYNKDGVLENSLIFSNFEVGTVAGQNVPSGERADMFTLYYSLPDDNYIVQPGEIIYGLEAGSEDMGWISIMAVGGVSTGSTEQLENGYIYSEGVDMNSEVVHSSFIVETDGVNYKIYSEEDFGMLHLFGTVFEGVSFSFEGQIEYKKNEEWELNTASASPVLKNLSFYQGK